MRTIHDNSWYFGLWPPSNSDHPGILHFFVGNPNLNLYLPHLCILGEGAPTPEYLYPQFPGRPNSCPFGSLPLRQPWGFQYQAQGLHSPVPWSLDPNDSLKNEHIDLTTPKTSMKVPKVGVEPKIGGFYPPKWIVKIMVPTPMNKMDDLGGFSRYFWFNTHMNLPLNHPCFSCFFWMNLSLNHPLDFFFAIQVPLASDSDRL